MKKSSDANGLALQRIALSFIFASGLVVASCSQNLQENKIPSQPSPYEQPEKERKNPLKKERSSRLYPAAPYEYILNGKKYFFLAGKTTYQDVITQIGTPNQASLITILGRNKDGTKFITYRTVSSIPAKPISESDSLKTEKSSSATQGKIQIKDATFRFNEKNLLISAGLSDISEDERALTDWEQRRQPITTTEQPLSKAKH